MGEAEGEGSHCDGGNYQQLSLMPPTWFKVDLEEPRSVSGAEVQCAAVWEEQVSNSMNPYSQVAIKEEKPEDLDMWGFKDVIVGEVNILQHWKQRKIIFRSKQRRKI